MNEDKPIVVIDTKYVKKYSKHPVVFRFIQSKIKDISKLDTERIIQELLYHHDLITVSSNKPLKSNKEMFNEKGFMKDKIKGQLREELDKVLETLHTTEDYKHTTGDDDEDEEDDENTIRTSKIIDEEEGIFAEQAYNDGNSGFCVYNLNNSAVELLQEVVIRGITYKPLYGEEIEKGAILLPSRTEEYTDDNTLDNDIKQFIHKWLDVPDDTEQFIVWNVKRSWVYERFHTLNYLRALGDIGEGKSRYLDTAGAIHYKTISTSGATTTAPIFRIINKWEGSMSIDEADWKKTDESQDIIKIINQGYEKGKFIMRCDENNNDKIKFFDPYCPKIIATRRVFADKATESRCITTVMKGTSRKDIPPNINQSFNDEALHLRNKLLLWRFRNYFKIDPEKEITFDLGELEPRVKQIVSSFINLFSNNKEQMETFKEYIQKHQENIIDERKNSFDGSIVTAIYNLYSSGNKEFDNEDVINNGNLKGYTGKEMTPRSLTGKLKALGFGKNISKRVDDKIKRCIPLNEEHLKRLFTKYGHNIEEKQEFTTQMEDEDEINTHYP